MFKVGSSYTQDEIHEQVGGNKIALLPTVDRAVTAICMAKKLNPDAPDVILVGRGEAKERAAAWLVQRGLAVPMFIKRRSNEWVYQGDYRVSRDIASPDEIAKHARSSGRTDITRILFMSRGA